MHAFFFAFCCGIDGAQHRKRGIEPTSAGMRRAFAGSSFQPGAWRRQGGSFVPNCVLYLSNTISHFRLAITPDNNARRDEARSRTSAKRALVVREKCEAS